MSAVDDLILDVLFQLVERVPDTPRRILFRGVSDLSDAFRARVRQADTRWKVLVTGADPDVVGARNDVTIPVLVVFYRDDVRERESLNAFRQFNEDAIVEALVTHAAGGHVAPDSYRDDEVGQLRTLVDLAYPSVARLAAFLLAGKEQVGRALPLLGLFADDALRYDLTPRQWRSRLQENQAIAVMSWREFLEKGQRSRDARRLVGARRLALFQRAETDPAAKQELLEQISFGEALQIFNPPTRLVAALMQAGLLRERAEQLVADIKASRSDPRQLPVDIPPLSPALEASLKQISPVVKRDGEPEEDGPAEPGIGAQRVAFCLEGLLQLAGPARPEGTGPFPEQLCLASDDERGEAALTLAHGSDGQWAIEISAEDTRVLAEPATGAAELRFKVFTPDRPDRVLIRFALENRANRLEPFREIWPAPDFWNRAAALDARHAPPWRRLEQTVGQIRNLVDPDWRHEQEEDEDTPDREPNNAVYLIFDLLYLSRRDLFEDFLDAWIAVATLPWRADVAAAPAAWRECMATLLQIGLAAQPDVSRSVAVLPFHPIRLIWHRAVFQQIERWLDEATRDAQPLVFEPSVLAEQLQAEDRPPVLFFEGQRLVEATTAPFFSTFVTPERQRRARAPLYRAQQKLEQFGRMWPFSLARLHLAFQPQDAGQHVYRLLAQHASSEQDAAFRVRAIVGSTSDATWFDQQLMATGDATTDLLTQEFQESLFPRVDYAKGRLDDGGDEASMAAHVALLVDAFREENHGFQQVVGRLNLHPHWSRLADLARDAGAEAIASFKQVSLSTPPYHSGQPDRSLRDLVYVPMSGGQPEYLRMLVDSLCGWVNGPSGAFQPGAYYERVRWDAQALARLHQRADWVILFDRTIDKALFQRELEPSNVRLIDFYANLPGGYRLSISSRRIDAVEWQLVQVLRQFFGGWDTPTLRAVARHMLDTLAGFASGLLLKTLGGGSLAQELLGLYATYRSLIADSEFDSARDWLIPLDNYQSWFGRRTQRGRRADLLVLRRPEDGLLELVAVESKWYKGLVGPGFVTDEFGEGGQLRIAVETLRSLFDPTQHRLDRDYWQRTLRSLLDEAPVNWKSFVATLRDGRWRLNVDGMVYVHHYNYHDRALVAQQAATLRPQVQTLVAAAGPACFALGPDLERLRLKSNPDLVSLLAAGS